MPLRRTAVLAVGLVALACGFAASLALGAVKVPLSDVIDALLGNAEPGPFKQIVLTLRLPRTVEAVLVGGPAWAWPGRCCRERWPTRWPRPT